MTIGLQNGTSANFDGGLCAYTRQWGDEMDRTLRQNQ